MTNRERILRAIKALMTQVSGPPAGSVTRSRSSPVGRLEMPAINITPEESDPSEGTNGGVDQRLSVAIEVYAAGDEPDSLADPLVEQVHSLMMADTTLGGLAIDVSDAGTRFELDDSEQPMARVTMRFSVWHRHNRNDLAQP